MVPEGWITTELGEVATFKSGGTPSKQKVEYWGGSYPWVSAKDMKQHFINNSQLKLTEAGYAEAKKAPKGTVLILVRGMTLHKDIPICFTTKELAFNQDVKALLPKKHVDLLYLSYLLVGCKKSIGTLVNTAGHGTGRLDTLQLKEFPLTIPPKVEQQKIAQILSTWDKAIETVEALIEKSTLQKKALMQQLLTGEKRLDGFGDQNWVSGDLGTFVEKIVGGGTPSRNIAEFWNGEIPWVTVKDLISPIIKGAQEYITEVGLKNSAGNLIPAGTVIMATRMAVGKIVMATCDVVINQDLKAIIPKKLLGSKYLYYWLIFHSGDIERLGTGSTVKGVQLGDIRRLKISFPTSIQEQQMITSIFDDINLVIINLREQLVCLQQQKQALMQQLLTGKRRVRLDEAPEIAPVLEKVL